MPEDPCPPEQGWSLLEAAEALFPDHFDWLMNGPGDLRHRADRMGASLCRRVIRERDDLTFAGRDLARDLDAAPVIVPRDLVSDDGAPEGSLFLLSFWDSKLELRFPRPARSVTLHAVRVVLAHPRPVQPAAPRKPQRARSGFAESDAPLVQEMRAMIREGKARNAWDAAQAVAPRAAGSTHGDSRAKRLLARYSELFSTE